MNRFFYWWSSPIKIRTERRLDLFKRDRLRPMLIVISQYRLSSNTYTEFTNVSIRRF